MVVVRHGFDEHTQIRLLRVYNFESYKDFYMIFIYVVVI
jgi:hypothetical protein